MQIKNGRCIEIPHRAANVELFLHSEVVERGRQRMKPARLVHRIDRAANPDECTFRITKTDRLSSESNKRMIGTKIQV